MITLPDGSLRAVLAIEPLNFDCRSLTEQDTLAAGFASLAGSLAPGQILQVLLESRPSDASVIVPQVLGRMTTQQGDLGAFVDAYRPWLERQLARTHVPDLRYFLIVSPVPPRASFTPTRRTKSSGVSARRGLELAVDELGRHLGRLGVGMRRLGRAETVRLLWESLHAPGEECPPIPSFDDTPVALPRVRTARARKSGPLFPLFRPVRSASLIPHLTPAPIPDLTPSPLPGLSPDLTPALSPFLSPGLGAAPAPLAPETVNAYWLQQWLCTTTLSEAPMSLRLDKEQAPPCWVRSLFLLAPPELTDPGWLDPLLGLDCPFRFSLYLEGRDRNAERTRLKRRRRSLNVITLGSAQSGSVVDVDMESAQAEARQQALETLDPARTILKLGCYLTVFAQDSEQLADHTERALSLLKTRLGAEVGRGIGHQLPLWQASLPLACDVAERRYRVRSETIGNAFPFLTHNPGMPSGFPLGFTSVGHELVLFDPADPSLPNSLMNIVGRSGSGKTMLAQKLTLMTILAGGRATVIDRSGHYDPLVTLTGGSVARLGAPDPPALNLWEHDGVVTAEKIGFIVDAHEVLLARESGERLDPLVRALLERGVRAVYARHHTTIPTEGAFVTWLEEEASQTEDVTRRELLAGLAARLEPYVREGRHAALLDRQTTLDLAAPLLVFDLDGLAASLHALAMFLIAEVVDRRAKRRRATEGRAHGVRELLVIDEGWFLVKYAAAGAWIEELARRGRHWGLFLVFITQQLSDLIDDPTAATLFNAASVQLLFRQKDQQSAEGEGSVSWLAEALGLSHEETTQLSRLSGVKGEYTEMLLLRESKQSAIAQRGIVQVFCHPLEYWLFTSEPLRDVPYRKQMVAALGDLWAAVQACAAGQEVPELVHELREEADDALPTAAH